jgi:GTP-binding protein EngB required for normal cell division
MRISPQDSHQCFDAIANHGGVVLFLGRSDVAKSTRIQELVGQVTGRGDSVAELCCIIRNVTNSSSLKGP